MEHENDWKEALKSYGIGRRKLDDNMFINDKPLPTYGIYDIDDENLCHEIANISCNIPGCHFLAESLLEYEDHYNSSHRYSCGQCKKILPSPHILDLHLQENHDSFFAVMAEKKPSYCCYIEDCKNKFMTAEERNDHAIKVHKLPKDFRYDQKLSRKKSKQKNKSQMDVDSGSDTKKLIFTNSKQKTFPKYTGKKFTGNKNKTNQNTEMEITVSELQKSLPE